MTAELESSLLNTVNSGLIVLDSTERVLRWNAWLAATSGYSEQEARGKTLSELFPAANLKRLEYAVKTALQSSASTLITHALNPALLPLHTRAGRPLLHDISVSPVMGRAGSECLISITDVTMATRRERYLRDQQNARYDAVVGSAPDVIITIDEEGAIQLANPAALAQFGYSHGELVGSDAAVLFENHGDWQRIWRGVLEGSVAPNAQELIGIRKDGSRTYLEASASRWAIATRIFATIILRDVSERRAKDAALRESEEEARDIAAALASLNENLEQRVQERTAQLMKAEEALRQSQKMESIGNLTGGIAHDFNNLLQVISGNLALLRRDVLGNAAAEQRVRNAVDAVKRSAKLSMQLLAFARRQTLDPKVINLGRFLTEMEDILRRAVGEGVAVDLVVAPDLWNALVDPGNVENALLNIAINARDAMDGDGTLTIEATNTILATDHMIANQEVIRGEYVLLAVSDTGSGMSPEIIEKVFEPFFTTKEAGKGTGLGLSMVYGFVKQSGGHIQIDSVMGEGTTIKIYLPRSTRMEDRLVNLDSIPVEGGTEMILVAEDDDSVRESVVAMLSDLGYRVIKAKDAHSALVIIESGMPIDLLFTDVVMPGSLRSVDLANKARERSPNLAVLFTSGYSEVALKASGRTGTDFELLKKPYSREMLARKIRHVLASATQQQASRNGSANTSASGPARQSPRRRVLVCAGNSLHRSATIEMLKSGGYDATPAANGRAALAMLTYVCPDILLSDTTLPDMPGAKLAQQATSVLPGLAVLFAGDKAEAQSGTQAAMVLIRPFSSESLLSTLEAAAILQGDQPRPLA